MIGIPVPPLTPSPTTSPDSGSWVVGLVITLGIFAFAGIVFLVAWFQDRSRRERPADQLPTEPARPLPKAA